MIKDQILEDGFARFIELQENHTRLSQELAQLEVTINREAMAAASSNAEAYVVLQEEIGKLEIELKLLFERHPEWRGDHKSVTTPYGSVKQHTSKELDVPNDAMTVALIEGRATLEKGFKAEDFLHITKKPNLEALERLNDDELSKLGVNRLKKETITVKPAKVSVSKAVNAAKQEA